MSSREADMTVSERDLELDVYVPFCDSRKCNYCTRLVCLTNTSLVDQYTEALANEIRSAAEDLADRNVRTIHVTGGCPTTLRGAGLLDVFAALRRSVPGFESAAITFDIVPGHFTQDIMAQLGNNPVAHIRVGLQTADEDEFLLLGRPFEFSAAMATLSIGIDAFNIRDRLEMMLLYAIPGQTEPALERSLDTALGFDPDRVSLSPLELGPGTPLFERVPEGSVERLSLDERKHLFSVAHERLVAAGYQPYTIGHYAKPGRENSLYLLRTGGIDRMGFGVGARTRLGDITYRNTADLDHYIAHSADLELMAEGLIRFDQPSQVLSYVERRLTALDGVSVHAFESTFAHEYGEVFGAITAELASEDLVSRRDGAVVLTARGTVAAAEVLGRISSAVGISDVPQA